MAQKTKKLIRSISENGAVQDEWNYLPVLAGTIHVFYSYIVSITTVRHSRHAALFKYVNKQGFYAENGT